jgi:hypothetical protein
MKNIPISLGLLLLALRLPAQEPVDTKSQITQVTVFLQSAQITREAQVQIAKGEAQLVVAATLVAIDLRGHPGELYAAAYALGRDKKGKQDKGKM